MILMNVGKQEEIACIYLQEHASGELISYIKNNIQWVDAVVQKIWHGEAEIRTKLMKELD